MGKEHSINTEKKMTSSIFVFISCKQVSLFDFLIDQGILLKAAVERGRVVSIVSLYRLESRERERARKREIEREKSRGVRTQASESLTTSVNSLPIIRKKNNK